MTDVIGCPIIEQQKKRRTEVIRQKLESHVSGDGQFTTTAMQVLLSTE
jgi:hypothetical protein